MKNANEEKRKIYQVGGKPEKNRFNRFYLFSVILENVSFQTQSVLVNFSFFGTCFW